MRGCDHESCKAPTLGDGSFEMCQDCYISGKTCNDAKHPLTMYLAYRRPESAQTVYGSSHVFCDRCHKDITDPVCYRKHPKPATWQCRTC